MRAIRIVYYITVLVSVFALVWVAMPGIRELLPVWLMVDALVVQLLMLAAISRML